MKIRIKKNKKVIQEAAMGPEDLPEDYYVEISEGQGWVEVSYKTKNYDEVDLEGAIDASELFVTCIDRDWET